MKRDVSVDRCTCDHLRVWHWSGQCEFHCGNPERCPCTGFRLAADEETTT